MQLATSKYKMAITRRNMVIVKRPGNHGAGNMGTYLRVLVDRACHIRSVYLLY